MPRLSTSDDLQPNPYDFTRPIQKAQQFAGRHELLDDVTYYLEMARLPDPRYHSMVLVGERGSGKTSTLYQIRSMAEELGYLPVLLPINDRMVQNEMEFVKELFDALMDAGQKRGAFNGSAASVYQAYKRTTGMLRLDTDKMGLPEVPFRFVASYIGYRINKVGIGVSQADLHHDISVFFQEIQHLNIPAVVLLFDECDLFSHNPILLQTVRNVLQAPDVPGYITIFAGTPRMFEVMTETRSPIFRQFVRLYLTGLDRHEAEECIIRPLLDPERHLFDYSCIEEIYRLTDGKPYELQLICHFMYKRFSRQHRPTLTLDQQVLDDVLAQLEAERRVPMSRVQSIKALDWQALTELAMFIPYESWTVNQIARYEVACEILKNQSKPVASAQLIANCEAQHKETLKALTRRGLITVSNDERVFTNGDRFEKLYLKYYAKSQRVHWKPIAPIYAQAAADAVQEILTNSGLARGLSRRLSATEQGDTLGGYINRWKSELEAGTLVLEKDEPEIFVVEEQDFVRSVVYQLRRPEVFAGILRLGEKGVPLVAVKYRLVTPEENGAFIEFYLPRNPRLSRDQALARFVDTQSRHSGYLEALGIQVEEILAEEMSFPPLAELARVAALRDNAAMVRDVQLAYVTEGREVFRADDVNKSLELFRAAVELQVTNQDPLYIAIAHNNLGFVLVAKEKYEEALRAWQTALALYPATYGRLGMTYQDMSYVYAKLHRWTDALQACRDAIEVDKGRDTRVGWLWIRFCETNLPTPNSWKWELITGAKVTTSAFCNFVAIYMANGQVDAAEKALSRALLLSPNVPEVYRTKGWFELAQGHWVAGLEAFNKARELDPRNPIVDEEVMIASDLVRQRAA